MAEVKVADAPVAEDGDSCLLIRHSKMKEIIDNTQHNKSRKLRLLLCKVVHSVATCTTPNFSIIHYEFTCYHLMFAACRTSFMAL